MMIQFDKGEGYIRMNRYVIVYTRIDSLAYSLLRQMYNITRWN